MAKLREDIDIISYSCIYIPRDEYDRKSCRDKFTPEKMPEICERLQCNFLRAFCVKKHPTNLEGFKKRFEGKLLYDRHFQDLPNGDCIAIKHPMIKVISISKEGDSYHLLGWFASPAPHKGIAAFTQEQMEQLCEEQDELEQLPDYDVTQDEKYMERYGKDDREEG